MIYGAMTLFVIIFYAMGSLTGARIIYRGVDKLFFKDYYPALISTGACAVFAVMNALWMHQCGWQWHGMDEPAVWILGHSASSITALHYHGLLYNKLQRGKYD